MLPPHFELFAILGTPSKKTKKQKHKKTRIVNIITKHSVMYFLMSALQRIIRGWGQEDTRKERRVGEGVVFVGCLEIGSAGS